VKKENKRQKTKKREHHSPKDITLLETFLSDKGMTTTHDRINKNRGKIDLN
jgi:hypothetical protein